MAMILSNARIFTGGMDAGWAKAVGIHLEGPFLNPEKCGAQNPAYLRALDAGATVELIPDGMHVHPAGVWRWSPTPSAAPGGLLRRPAGSRNHRRHPDPREGHRPGRRNWLSLPRDAGGHGAAGPGASGPDGLRRRTATGGKIVKPIKRCRNSGGFFHLFHNGNLKMICYNRLVSIYKSYCVDEKRRETSTK